MSNHHSPTPSEEQDHAFRLGRIPVFGAIILVITAVFSTGFHHWDEHFQILEFAAWKLGITPVQDLPWEFAARIRPALQPMIVVQMHHLLNLFGSQDPFVIALLLRLLSAGFSFIAINLMISAFLPSLSDPRLARWFVLLSFFLWFSLYNAVRFSSENWSGALFMIGFALLIGDRDQPRTRTFLISGILFGLSFTIRPQAALMIAGLLAWMILIHRERVKNLFILVVGAVTSIAVGIITDRCFYGEWTLSTLNYFEVNIVQGKANAFGTEPWYTYIAESVLVTLPPFSVLFILAPLVLLLFAPRNVLVWVLLPFVLVHTLIGHKELRFLFPVVGLLPIIIIQAIALVRERWSPELLSMRAVRIIVVLFWVVNSTLVAVIMFKPADAQIDLYRTIHHDYRDPIEFHYFDDDPFHRVEKIHFYRGPELIMGGRIGPDTKLSGNKLVLISTKRPADVEVRWPDHKLIYASLPSWAKHFDINGWLARTDQFYVFEVQP